MTPVTPRTPSASRETGPKRAPIKVATLLSFPLGPGTGLGSYVLGVTGALQQHPEFALSLVAPERERGSAGQRGSQVWLALQQLVQLCRLQPDVVHAHDHPALLAAAVAYQRLSRAHHGPIRVVFTSHLDPVEPRAAWKRVVLGRLLAHCSGVTVAARDSLGKLDWLATPVPSLDRVQVVPGAASVRIRDKSDPAVVAFGAGVGCAGGPVLLQVANFLFPAKVEGTLRLLEAFVQVHKRFPDARLLLVGRGPLLPRVMETRDRLGLAGVVAVPGTFIEDLSLPLGLADIHCHITLQDACPISILEAMHAGKAVVASRTGGIPETIEHGVSGLLVGDDPAEIGRTIVELLEHPERAQALGRRAQQVARCRFSWERAAADFSAIWRGTVQREPSSPDELDRRSPVSVEDTTGAPAPQQQLPC